MLIVGSFVGWPKGKQFLPLYQQFIGDQSVDHSTESFRAVGLGLWALGQLVAVRASVTEGAFPEVTNANQSTGQPEAPDDRYLMRVAVATDIHT